MATGILQIDPVLIALRINQVTNPLLKEIGFFSSLYVFYKTTFLSVLLKQECDECLGLSD